MGQTMILLDREQQICMHQVASGVKEIAESKVSLRDYFASQAMIALAGWKSVETEEELVMRSYRVADLMLKQRDVKGE